ncbi:MAG TPA: S1 RNA-binding domain-containing protein [Planctomycetaceae bacterium]|nr:S1 RNA-binding domain-containing protein [Planctomycetaceae bacterium]
MNPEQDKAVPYTTATAAEEAPPAAEPAPVAQKQAGPAVEIPRNADLDAEMEAEIAAAMASGEMPEAAPQSAPHAAADKAPTDEDQLEPGTRVKGRVQSASGENVILDLGFRSSGCIPARQFEGNAPEVGAELDVVVDKVDHAEGLIFCSLPKASRPVANWSEVQVGQVVDCMVTKTNKGGLEVTVSNIRGFLPAGQVDIGYVSNLEQFVGQKLRVKVTEVNPQKRNLVVSRRAFLEIARAESRDNLWKTLAVGQTFQGVVKTIKDYGAFVDIGGVDGLLHVGEISWSRVGHPSDVLHESQQIEVQVVGIDREKSKISLGMRQLQKNPWRDIESRYAPNTVVHGTVTKTTDFGAFVQLEPGVEGLVHISELDHRRVNRVTDVLNQGQEIDAQVLSVDTERKRIALSVKALRAKPETEPKVDDVDLAPGGGASYERKRKGPLKGGTGSGGFMFGNNYEE